MKNFKEMTTDETLDLLCDVTPYVGNIVEDKDFVKIISEKIKLDDDSTEKDFKEAVVCKSIQKIIKMIPLTLKKHREDVFNILSIINEKTIEEIKAQNITITIKEIKEILMNKDMMDFFIELVK